MNYKRKPRVSWWRSSIRLDDKFEIARMNHFGARRFGRALIGLLALFIATSAVAIQDDFLSVDQAFVYSVTTTADALLVSYIIRDGYFLYRQRLGFSTDTPHVTIGIIGYSKGLPHHDEYFGDQEIYRGKANFRIPYTLAEPTVSAIDLKLKLQGCADRGLCYPPQIWTAHVVLSPAPAGKSVSRAKRPAAASHIE